MKIQNQNNLVSAGYMARLAKVPSSWLKKEAEAGRIPALKAGERFVFEPKTVLSILVERAKKRDVEDG